eukprot:gene42441-52632_t
MIEIIADMMSNEQFNCMTEPNIKILANGIRFGFYREVLQVLET